MNRLTSPFAGSLLVIGIYMLIRNRIYHYYPDTSQEAWFMRDIIMSLPRLGAFAALLLLNRNWKVARFEWQWRDFRRALTVGLPPLLLWIFYFSGGHGQSFEPWMKAVGLLTSLIVGLFEEYAFRGPLLTALRQRLPMLAAVVIGSALFTIYHVQAQAVHAWGVIFLTGVIFSNLRLRGLSLGWLALIHGSVDAAYFWFPVSSHLFDVQGLVFHAGLLIYAVMTFPRTETQIVSNGATKNSSTLDELQPK